MPSGKDIVVEARAATVRKEEREAVWRKTFKELCPDCAEGDGPAYDKQA